MKRVRIMLMSLVVVAAVGGALAFNVKSVGWYCTTSQTGVCNVLDNTTALQPATPQTGKLANKFCTDNPGAQAPCITMTTEQ